MVGQGRAWLLTGVLFAGCTLSGSLFAQGNLPTTVQLPSFSFFSYSGTVVVPDQGAAHLGGVNRSATGLNRRGLSRGFGASSLRSNATAHATIIDQREMDRQLLGGTPRQFLHDQQRRSETRRTVDPSEEGKALVRYARKLYREGKSSQSFDTYLMAIEILPQDLSKLAAREFKRVFGTAADQALRRRS